LLALRRSQQTSGHFPLRYRKGGEDNPFGARNHFSELLRRLQTLSISGGGLPQWDVRHLVGKNIEIHGKIEDYDGHTEIVLKRLRQLQGDAGKIPPLPKGFDVEKKGRYNAGRLSHPKSTRPKSSKRQSHPIQMEDPEIEE
jgi:hypothetical protein